ncbi:MAG: hypothetical protein D6736_07325 [Nitrospinota bacterium]|nr:MAG: hypothetical protein D6736_07325 [Nitrospinota bacterium]
MSGFALGLVLTAAFLHASWNYLTKRSQSKLAFIWWFLLVGIIGYFPMFLYFWPRVQIPAAGWICIVVTGLLHAFYFWFLGGAYELGDLSLVYPLARGTAPLLVPFLATGFIHEQLFFLGMLGIGLIIAGIYLLHLPSFTYQSFWQPWLALKGGASRWALLTGGTIASYSLVDKVGVGKVYPPVYIYLMFVGTWLCLTPYVLTRKRAHLKPEWQSNRVPILAVGVLALFTYLLILFALRMSKVSYVVALRESSILFASLYGILWLHEEAGRQKFVGAFLIFAGAVCIGLSR